MERRSCDFNLMHYLGIWLDILKKKPVKLSLAGLRVEIWSRGLLKGASHPVIRAGSRTAIPNLSQCEDPNLTSKNFTDPHLILAELLVSVEREIHMIMIKASMNSLTIVNHISICTQLKKCDICTCWKHYVLCLIYYTVISWNGWSYFAPLYNRINLSGFVLLPDDEKRAGIQKRRLFRRKWGNGKYPTCHFTFNQVSHPAARSA